MQCASPTHDDNVNNRGQRQHHISMCDWNVHPPDVGGSSAEEWEAKEGPPSSVSSDSAGPRFDPVPADGIQHDTAVLHAIRCETRTDIRVLRRHKVSTFSSNSGAFLAYWGRGHSAMLLFSQSNQLLYGHRL